MNKHFKILKKEKDTSHTIAHLMLFSHAFCCMHVEFRSTMVFSPLENSNYVAVSVSIDFLSNLKWDAPFHYIAYGYSCADWDGLCDDLKDSLWEDIFKLCYC